LVDVEDAIAAKMRLDPLRVIDWLNPSISSKDVEVVVSETIES
jgi:hypothetical protein